MISWKDDPASFLGFGTTFSGANSLLNCQQVNLTKILDVKKGGEKYQNLSQKPKIQVVHEDILDLLMVAGRNKNRFSNRFPFNGGLMLIYHGSIRKE